MSKLEKLLPPIILRWSKSYSWKRWKNKSNQEIFEEIYREAAEKIDEIAERVLALGGTPKGSLKNIVSNAHVESHEEIMEANKMVEAVVTANKILIGNLNELLDAAGKTNDEGTTDIFTSYIQELEKQNWMFKSYLQ